MSSSVDLNHLVFALSNTLDLVGVDDLHHSKRVAYMVREMAKAKNLSIDTQDHYMQAALLHDCGVSSSLAHEELLSNFDWQFSDDHCTRGFNLLMQSEQLKKFAFCVLFHHTHWKDLIYLEMQESCKILTNTIFLCDRVDALMQNYLKDETEKYYLTAQSYVYDKLESLKGDFFSPELVDTFIKMSKLESFWFGFREDILQRYYQKILKKQNPLPIGVHHLHEIALLFANFVDAKSHFTASHSINVAKVAHALALKMGLSEEVAQKLEIAGLLHDIGKLIIPDEILDKPSSLYTKRNMLLVKEIML
jgi:putative nucleotidyltransferase with HDIG domain